MPSKHIIPSCARTIQTKFIPYLPKATIPQFRFGVQALTLKPFTSLASNARQTVAHPDTASTKMDRLVANQRLAQVLTERIAALGLVSPQTVIACDHSDFNGLMAFMGAVQTGKGRAVPVLAETAYSPRLPAHDDAPKRKRAMRRAYREQEQGLHEQVQQTLAEFADRLGFWPRLVFDRGFGSLSLIGFLVKHEATFYIRLKAGRLVELGSKRRQVR